jgi:N-acetylglucosaminyldiphosphoundecaprenol N-acetyl-beta-D-mannosaminyltransferase
MASKKQKQGISGGGFKTRPYALLLGRRFFAAGLQDAVACLLQCQQGCAIHAVNAHTCMEALRDPELWASQQSAVLLPDGRPLTWAAQWLGQKTQGQVRGPDVMLQACGQGVAQGARHFFWGGAEGVAQRAKERLCGQMPGLKVVGAECPPFREPNDKELKALLVRLKRAKATHLWVGLGAPKQEKTMARLLALGLPIPAVGVGAAFDLHAGLRAEAPPWAQRAGMEWLLRLLQEPRRLWRRYLINNPLFLYHVILQKLGRRYV